jgi:hypothetical protein
LSTKLSRRTLLLAAGASGIALPTLADSVSQDPRLSAEGQIRLSASLDGSPAFWIYSGTVYAVQPGLHPRELVRLSGCQSSWAERLEDGSYRVSGATLTFFRDCRSGTILDYFDNPITGRRNKVVANFLSGGALRYPADGTSARAEFRPATGSVIAPNGFGAADLQKPLGLVRWQVMEQSVLLFTDRSWNVAVQPQLEAQTQSGDRADFFDPALRRMTARYSGTSIMPWMTWLEMADIPGHLTWHSSGEKSFSLDGLEADYRAHAGDRLDRLASRP